MQTITRQELSERLERDENLAVVEVLPHYAYSDYHLPGAINVPVGESFRDEIQKAVPDKQKPVVVYCRDSRCTASPKAAREMDDLGYARVYDYEAGKNDWREAGLPIEK